ncbi:MAG: hypothetical protein KAF27_07750 [Porphyrobacter sp.]|nr:hypothetical protein [Porphyrobacter sp.]
MNSLRAIIAASLVACAPAVAADDSPDPRAILERTKTTGGTFTIHYWNSVTIPGETAFEEASAEFHQGDLHRVETPRDRVVADCRAQTGAHLFVAAGEVVEGPMVATYACGISTHTPILSLERLPDTVTKFGPAQRVRVTDARFIRDYTVLANGALVHTVFSENSPEQRVHIVAEAFFLEEAIPAGMAFDKASLATPFLPQGIRP